MLVILKTVHADQWYRTRKVEIKRVRRERERARASTRMDRRKRVWEKKEEISSPAHSPGVARTVHFRRPNDLIPQIHVAWTTAVLNHYIIWIWPVLCGKMRIEEFEYWMSFHSLPPTQSNSLCHSNSLSLYRSRYRAYSHSAAPWDLIPESPLFGISHHTKAYYLIIFYVNFLFIMIP